MDADQRHEPPPTRGAGRRRGARQLSRAALAVTVGVTLWSLFYPEPHALLVAVLAALPCCALLVIARSHGFFHADDKGIYGGIAALCAVPSLILLARALVDVHLAEWWQALPVAALGAAAFAFVVTRADHRILQRRGGIAGTLIFAGAYAYGLAAETDQLFDRSPPQSFRLIVLDKHNAGGLRSPVLRHFTVGPWGPRPEADDITVSRATFHAIERGHVVCLALRPGALAIPWYDAEIC
jgi:hypothetical protein